jgi:L-alanine-DL-glutamate epimerase-like enolase superfamily enzyme
MTGHPDLFDAAASNSSSKATIRTVSSSLAPGFIAFSSPHLIVPSPFFWPRRENIATVKKWREAVGPDFPIMIDCYMSLTLPYAIELARKCEPYDVKWIEEALPPDNYEGYSELKKAVRSTLITTGEHEVRAFIGESLCGHPPLPFA